MSGSMVYFPTKKMTKVTLTSSGNFTVPEGVTTLFLDMYGAGGSGAARNGVSETAAYGGESGSKNFNILSVTPGQIIPYVIGTGGTGVTNGKGTNGGNTQFGTLQAPGGKGGSYIRTGVGSGDLSDLADGRDGWIVGADGVTSSGSQGGGDAGIGDAPGGIAAGGNAANIGTSGPGGNGIIYVYYNNPTS